MKLKKYIAPDTRTALIQIREELGNDAIIYSNRRVKNGVEIIASIESDDTIPIKTKSTSYERTPHREAQNKKEPVYSEYLETPQEAALKALESEFKSLKSLVQEQLSNLIWDKKQRLTPKQAMLLRNLLQRGFESNIVKRIVQSVNDELPIEALMDAVEKLITDTLTSYEIDLHNLKGVICFLGSPGVGKTMTLTKLATQLALKNGPDRLAILSTDNKKIGAFEEISIYGKICHIPVHCIEDNQSLLETLKACHQCETLLLDTPGISPYDSKNINHLAELLTLPRKIHPILVLPASSQSECIEDTIQAYKRFPLEGVIITKLDEVKRYGTILSAVMMSQLKIISVSSGLNIPDNLMPFEKSNLVSDALYLEQCRAEHLAEDMLARMISEVDIHEI